MIPVRYLICGFISRMPPDPSLRRNSRHSADSQFDDLSDEDIMRAVQRGDGDAFLSVWNGRALSMRLLASVSNWSTSIHF